MSDCRHLEFESRVGVGRLLRVEGGEPTSFSADIMIRCRRCKLPFRFIGVLGGSSPHEPRVSVDGSELRAPIEPAPGAWTWEQHDEFTGGAPR